MFLLLLIVVSAAAFVVVAVAFCTVLLCSVPFLFTLLCAFCVITF